MNEDVTKKQIYKRFSFLLVVNEYRIVVYASIYFIASGIYLPMDICINRRPKPIIDK